MKNKKILLLCIINAILFVMVTILVIKGGYISKIFNKAEFVNNQYEARVTTFNAYETKDVDTVFIGDSITQRCDFGELFGDSNIVSRGIDSDTTEGMLKRIDDIINIKPEKVFILAGVNDISLEFETETTLNNYKSIINKLKENNIEVYCLSVLPVTQSFREYKNNEFNKAINSLNKEIEKLSGQLNLMYIDLNSKLLNGEYLNDEYSIDGIHLNGVGYKVIKENLKEFVHN